MREAFAAGGRFMTTDVVEVPVGSRGAARTGPIREGILRGDFAPNQRLLESDLSELLGATRAGVRRELLALEKDGLVERTPHRGARVKAISLDEALEILEVRVALEPLCAAQAALRHTDDDALELLGLRVSLLRTVAEGDVLTYADLHQRLDLRLRELSGHRTAAAILDRLRAQSRRDQFRLALQPGRAALSMKEHVSIIDAVLARDAGDAAASTEAHLRSVTAAVRLLPTGPIKVRL